MVSQDDATIEVEDPLWDQLYGWYYFDRFTWDGGTDYSNPMTLPITKHTTVVAHYVAW